GHLDRVSQLVDAAQDGLAGLLAVNDLLCHCLNLSLWIAGPDGPLLRLENREHFVLAHDEVLLTVDLDFLTRVLPEQDGVAVFHVERLASAVFLDLALPGGDDLALLGLFLGGVRNDDSAHLLLALFEALNDDAVV